MFDFGPSYGDKEIYSDLEKKVDIGRGIQLYDDVYSSFYVRVVRISVRSKYCNDRHLVIKFPITNASRQNKHRQEMVTDVVIDQFVDYHIHSLNITN